MADALTQLARQTVACGHLTQLPPLVLRCLADTLGVARVGWLELLGDQRTLRLRAGLNLPGDWINQLSFTPLEQDQLGFALAAREPVIISDLAQEQYLQLPNLLAELGVSSSAAVLVDHVERPLGLLLLLDPLPRTYSTADRQFLLQVAELLSIAQVRLREQELTRAHSQTLERIAQDEPLRAVINDICLRSENMVSTAQAVVLLYEERTHRIRLGAGPSLAPELAQLLDNLEPGRTADVEAHAQRFGTKACWSTPVFIEQGKVVGTFALLHGLDAQPTAHDLQVLDHGARLVGLAVRRDRERRTLRRAELTNAQTESQLRQQTTELNRAADQLQGEITRRKRAEDLVRGGEERYRDLFENASDLIQIVEADGRLRFVNRAWRQALGYAENEVGRLMLMDVIHPDSRPRVGEWIKRALAGETSAGIEVKFFTREGKTLVAEGSFNGFVENGRLTGARAIFRDVTDRKQALEEQQKLVSLVQCSSDFIGMATLDGQLVFINDEGRRMVGLGQREPVSHLKLKDLFAPDTWPTIEKVALPASRQVDRWAGEGKLRHLTKRLNVDVQINVFLVRHPQSHEPLCVGMALQDITHRKEVDRMKDELVATVSHELRTPLTSLRGYAELLLARRYPEEKQQRFLKIIHDETLRLNKLINDFLDIRRMESGQQSYNRVSVDLIPLLSEVVHVYRQEDTQRFQWRTDLPNALPPVHADRDRIWQVLTNLISNAMKFSPAGSTITLTAKQQGSSVVVAVTDEGMGIARADQAHLFDKFFRAVPTDNRQHQGSGLGLAIVKEIVEAHDGRVTVDSTLGKGSTFSFSLPVISTTR